MNRNSKIYIAGHNGMVGSSLLRLLKLKGYNNLILRAQLFSDTGSKSYEYELSGRISDAENIGKLVGEELLKLAGSEFKKK